MAKKRGNGEGSISKYKDGRWCGRYTIQTARGPERKAIYGSTRKEAAKKLAEAMGDASRGIVFAAKGETTGAFMKRWLEDVVKPNKASSTYSSHRQQINSHIIPVLARSSSKLSVRHI